MWGSQGASSARTATCFVALGLLFGMPPSVPGFIPPRSGSMLPLVSHVKLSPGEKVFCRVSASSIRCDILIVMYVRPLKLIAPPRASVFCMCVMFSPGYDARNMQTNTRSFFTILKKLRGRQIKHTTIARRVDDRYNVGEEKTQERSYRRRTCA